MNKYLKLSMIGALALSVFGTVMSQSNGVSSEEAEKLGLTKLEYDVMYNDATERPGSSELLSEKRSGWYVDKVSGKKVFHSSTKFESGTGWPSFYKPISLNALSLEEDNSFGFTRTEVRSADGKRHYGHVFTDGPEPTGLRYCMNGAAFDFIPDGRTK